MQDAQQQLVMHVDQAKAALHRNPVVQVAQTLAWRRPDAGRSAARAGISRAGAHVVEFNRPERSSEEGLENIRLRGSDGAMGFRCANWSMSKHHAPSGHLPQET